MTDLSAPLTDRLKQVRIPGLDLGGEFVYPAYDGQSILNIPASICHWLGVAPIDGQPLIPEIHAFPRQEEIRQVIVILMDALSLRRLQGWLKSGSLPVWGRLGDYLVVPHAGAYLWWHKKDNHMLGRNGGLHPDEMLVPFLAAEL